MTYRSFKVCQGCNCGIQRGGVIVSEKYYHKSCFRKKLKGYNGNLIANLFKAVRQYGELKVDLSKGFF